MDPVIVIGREVDGGEAAAVETCGDARVGHEGIQCITMPLCLQQGVALKLACLADGSIGRTDDCQWIGGERPYPARQRAGEEVVERTVRGCFAVFGLGERHVVGPGEGANQRVCQPRRLAFGDASGKA